MSVLSPPIRATYGERDNAHSLLKWESSERFTPPVDLLGLTDRPPGSYGPSERWGPSVGCGPVGAFWALWWTEPDLAAKRAGMVVSEVGLWPIEQIGFVSDLSPALKSLSRGSFEATEDVCLLRAVVEALVDTQSSRPVLADLDEWPRVLCALWARMWPNARIAFSARVAISPPQTIDVSGTPSIFATTRERAPQWSAYHVVRNPGPLDEISRSAAWMIGSPDLILDEVLGSIPPLSSKLSDLRRAARAADRLESMRQDCTPTRAVELLRTLISVAPSRTQAKDLKTEATNAIVKGLASAGVEQTLSMANLAEASLETSDELSAVVLAWCANNAGELGGSEIAEFLERLRPLKAEPWWQKAVTTALVQGFEALNHIWLAAALRWITTLSLPIDILNSLIAINSKVETGLVSLAQNSQLLPSQLERLRTFSQLRGWSTLYGSVELSLNGVQAAFVGLLKFEGARSAGIAYVAQNGPEDAVVGSAIVLDDQSICDAVAFRTAKHPAMISGLDAGVLAWRRLWMKHISAGGTVWPSGIDRDIQAKSILQVIIDKGERFALVRHIADDLAQVVLEFLPTVRTRVWHESSTTERELLLPRAAARLAKQISTGDSVDRPEPELVREVYEVACRATPSVQLVAALLTWQAPISEQRAIEWIRSNKLALNANACRIIGAAISVNRWGQTAIELYGIWRGGASHIYDAVCECQALLSRWQRWILDCYGNPTVNGTYGSPAVAERLSELAATLAPDQLEYVWERAGGERKNLPHGDTPSARWHSAVRLAQNGALSSGLQMLVSVLLEERPHNKDLLELADLLNRI